MPAVSRSQQRLFGMVHAYNKGELHGNRPLRRRIAALARHVSDEDAKHFAKTPHEGLPEKKDDGDTKKAQLALRPDSLSQVYDRLPPMGAVLPPRSRKRRSLLRRVVSGAAVGTAIGGVGAGALGWAVANHAASGSPLGEAEINDRLTEAALKCGLWGAGKGALVGSLTGLGAGILDRIRE